MYGGLNHLILQPKPTDAKLLQADVLEQMGYQAESGPWRNFYSLGLLNCAMGLPRIVHQTTSPEIVSNMTMELIFGYMAIQINADKAAGKNITINWSLTDTKQDYTLFLENSVLNHWPNSKLDNAQASVYMTRETLNQFLMGQIGMEAALKNGSIKVEGDMKQFLAILGC